MNLSKFGGNLGGIGSLINFYIVFSIRSEIEGGAKRSVSLFFARFLVGYRNSIISNLFIVIKMSI